MGAQQITILDRETGEPVADVAVFNAQRSTSAISDASGPTPSLSRVARMVLYTNWIADAGKSAPLTEM